MSNFHTCYPIHYSFNDFIPLFTYYILYTSFLYSLNSTSFMILFSRLLLALWYAVSISWLAEVNSKRKNSISLMKFLTLINGRIGINMGVGVLGKNSKTSNQAGKIIQYSRVIQIGHTYHTNDQSMQMPDDDQPIKYLWYPIKITSL